MRALHDGLAEALASGVTTLCRCWRLTRRDGAVLGFTDHDRPVRFGGVDFEPDAGFTRTEIARGLGLSVDNLEAAGALRSEAVTEADLMRGLYDGAEIVQWLVDWRQPMRREVLFAGTVGEIRRGAAGFEMEVLGVSEPLNRPRGRAFTRACDAELGDGRCKAVLGPAFRGAGAVAAVQDARRFLAPGLAGVAPGWFDQGRLVWTSGANAGAGAAVRAHLVQSGGPVVDLWRAPDAPMGVGDAFEITAGCPKTAEACAEKFGNLENFRGFPLMPGEDWATSWAREEGGHDGGSLFRR